MKTVPFQVNNGGNRPESDITRVPVKVSDAPEVAIPSGVRLTLERLNELGAMLPVDFMADSGTCRGCGEVVKAMPHHDTFRFYVSLNVK